MKSSSGSVRQRRGRSSRGAPTAPAVSEMLVSGLSGQVTPDRQYLVFLVDEGGAERLRYAPLAADGSVGAAERVLKQSDPNIRAFDLSPTAQRWRIPFTRADGRLNAFLTDFPAGNRQLQVTTTGAGPPRFSRDGNALFYLARATPQTDPPRGALAKRPITLKPLDTSGPPVQLFVEGKAPPGVMLSVRRRERWAPADDAADGRRQAPEAAGASGAELASGSGPVERALDRAPRGRATLTQASRPHAARLSPSTCRSQPSSWFQLMKLRLTIFKLLIPNDRNFAPKLLIEPTRWRRALTSAATWEQGRADRPMPKHHSARNTTSGSVLQIKRPTFASGNTAELIE